jgi:hypothetical protein
VQFEARRYISFAAGPLLVSSLECTFPAVTILAELCVLHNG